MENMLKKIVSGIVCMITVSSITGVAASAQDVSKSNAEDEKYGWSMNFTEAQPQKDAKASRYYTPTWTLTNSQWISTTRGAHYHQSFIMQYMNDERDVMAKTNHYTHQNTPLYGYSRARFETAFGSPFTETDSGRIWGYGYTEAVTRQSSYSGVAHTYCGD